MTHSDKSKHGICIASIKRSTMQPYDFKWTKFYESNLDFENSYSHIQIEFYLDELIICSTIIDVSNFSILTTQRLITKEKGITYSGSLVEATDKLYGNFKGYKNDSITFGLVQLKDGISLKYFIETGKASMIMIHGTRTLIRMQQQTNQQIENVTRVWRNQNNK